MKKFNRRRIENAIDEALRLLTAAALLAGLVWFAAYVVWPRI